MSGFDQFRWDEGLWDGAAGPPPSPATGPAIFLGVIDAARVFLGDVNALLPLGIIAPVPALAPAFLGKINGRFSIGLLNAGAQRLGAVQGAAIRLGNMPVRAGM